MSWEAWTTVVVIGALITVLAKNWAPSDVVLLSALALLSGLRIFSDQFPSPREVALAFGNEGLVTIAALYVVAAGLTRTGGANLLAGRLLGRPRSVSVAQLRMMLPVMGLSAFINNTPIVAMFVPMVKDWCRRSRLDPSKLFIPLSYAAILGGVCTLIGTSTNLVVQGLLVDAREIPMGMFTIGQVGIPVALVGLLYILVSSKWLLPNREPLTERFGDPREYTVEMRVESGSPIDGRTVEEAGLRHLPGLYLVEVERDSQTISAVGPNLTLRGDDRLVFVGMVQSVADLQKIRGLVPATNQVFKLDVPRAKRCLVEAVISPTSPVVGKSIRQGRFRNRYDAAVIAVHRNGALLRRKIGDIVLRPGDTLLLETHEQFLIQHRDRRDFFLVSALDGYDPVRHERAWAAVLILVALVVMAALEPWTNLNLLPLSMVAAGLMVAFGCATPDYARRSIDWSILVSIGAAFGIARAIEKTGAGKATADVVMQLTSSFGTLGALAGVYLLTLLLTELVTNNAAAVLAFPVAKATAATVGTSLMPFALCVAVAASSGFATPLGYQTHMMVYGVGGYRFSDFLRIGLGLDAIVMITAVAALYLLFF